MQWNLLPHTDWQLDWTAEFKIEFVHLVNIVTENVKHLKGSKI